ncbi:MAG TPA: DNA alkylation repair protein [Thermodesulfovibrionales bacterium]|nr:DNA alkylation repair protein [Thermodesulfovibrionales bacterium]
MSKSRKQLISFRKLMRENANPERAVNEKRYLKSPFKFFGVSLPLTEKIAKEFRRCNKDAVREYIIEIVKGLWTSDYHDEKRLGLRILQQYPKYLDFSLMPMLEEMLMVSTGWDLVDDISIHLVGTVLEKDQRTYKYLKKWSGSHNFWMRRASLISQVLLLRNGRGDKTLFCSIAEKMISEKEFFIRKAIGWGLREMSKADSESVIAFLLKVKDRASGLTLREGSKILNESDRAMIFG